MRYLQFQRLLGSGAFGSVYLADLVADRGFRRQVAVKVMLKEQANSQMFMTRVRDEARLLGLLADDHILKVLELAKVEGRDAVLMEYVEGVDLNAIVEAGHRPPPRALAELGAAVAGALHRAHRAVHPNTGEALNVIHRDVKPANVMVTSRGSVKLLDFGVARARFEARESHTGQFVLGTLNYMAPEYIVTGEVSPAADIYGLALTLWEAACGEVFGQPKLRQDLHVARVEERLEVIAGTHAELVPILRQMLAWDAKARPDGATVERAFMAASDMIRGAGLRTWAGEAVPKVVAREGEAARDEVGLLGKTIPIGDEEPSEAPRPDARADVRFDARPEPERRDPAEATLHQAPRPAFLEDAPRPPGASGAHRNGAAQSGGSAPDARSTGGTPARGPTGARPPADARSTDARTTGARTTGGRTVTPGTPGGATGARKPAPKRSSGNMLLLQGLLLGGALGFLLLVGLGALLLLRGLF